MILLENNVKLIEESNNREQIAKCAAICYNTLSYDTNKLINNLINNKHYSMLRHATFYYKIPAKVINRIKEQYEDLYNVLMYNSYIARCYSSSYYYFAINGQTSKEYNILFLNIFNYNVGVEEIDNVEEAFFKIRRYTFEITTQISTTRELNRVSPNNIAEQSTRFCNYIKNKFGKQISIVKPVWFKTKSWFAKAVAKFSWKISEICYMILIKYCNLPAEEAREVLPLATKTVAAYTYTIEEWCHILNLRYYGTTGRPHPNAKDIAGLIKHELDNNYNVFDLCIDYDKENKLS